MRGIGVGLIGYGLGGRSFHAPFIRVTPGLTLRAIVSRDPERVSADVPGMRVVPTVAALLAEPEIDLVVVSSPDDLHAEHAISALAAGKHVVVDKPFATTLADARRVAAQAKTSGTLLSVYQNRRWDADFLTLRRLVSEGVLGRIVQVESHFDRWRPAIPSVWKEARESGSWQDLGPHLTDQMVQLFGRPDAVTADLAILRDDAPASDYFHVTLRYERMRVLLHSNKLVANNALRFAVHGSRGSWIKCGIDSQEAATMGNAVPGGDDWGVDIDPGVFTDAQAAVRAIPNERGDYRLFWQALVGAIRGEQPNPVTPEQALLVMEVLDAGIRSAAERREIAL